MQNREEHNSTKQKRSYQRGDFQAWKHLDGDENAIREAEKLGLRCLVLVQSHDIYIEDDRFLKELVRRMIETVVTPGIPLSRIVYLATKHDEPVLDDPEDESSESKIIGKRTAVHIKIVDYVLGLGLTIGLSFDGATYQRSVLYQQYVNKIYGFRDPSDGAPCGIHVEDSTLLTSEEDTESGAKICTNRQFKKRIEENVHIEFSHGEIQNRNDVILYMMNYGIITYCSETTISVYSHEQNDSFSFKGGIFSLNSFEAHQQESNLLRKELGFPMAEPEPEQTNTIQEIEEFILNQAVSQEIRSRNDLIRQLSQSSDIIYVSKYKIIIQIKNEQKQYNLYGGLFSRDGLENFIRESGRQHTPESGDRITDGATDILRDHRIAERHQFHDAFHQSSTTELFRKLKTLYQAGKARFRTRFKKAERRLLNSLEASFKAHGLPDLDTLGFGVFFDPAPFPNFPEPPQGHCGPCNIPPVPIKDRIKDDSNAQGSRKERGSTSSSRSKLQAAANTDRRTDQALHKIPRRETLWLHPPRLERANNSNSKIKENNESKNDDRPSDWRSHLEGLLGLTSMFSGLKEQLERFRSRINEATRRRRRLTRDAELILRFVSGIKVETEQSIRVTNRHNQVPRFKDRKVGEKDRRFGKDIT